MRAKDQPCKENARNRLNRRRDRRLRRAEPAQSQSERKEGDHRSKSDDHKEIEPCLRRKERTDICDRLRHRQQGNPPEKHADSEQKKAVKAPQKMYGIDHRKDKRRP